MLLLLLCVHRPSRSTSQAPAHILEPRGQTDSCDDIHSCRTLFDIVWGCLTTIFACTWVSVHPNVPPPNQTRLALLRRKLKMMLVAVVAPEVMVAFAVRQFWIARHYSAAFDMTRTHGFFISMGGFVTHPDRRPIVDADKIRQPGYLNAMKSVRVEDIMDRSKGDALSKGIAMMQGLWFVTQCLARIVQRLPMTEIEVSTLAFALLNVFIWVLWWEKPLDVQEPIMMAVEPHTPTLDIPKLRNQPRHRLTRYNRFYGMFNGYYSIEPLEAVPSFWFAPTSPEYDLRSSISFKSVVVEGVLGMLFAAVHIAAWHIDFPSKAERWLWRSCALFIAGLPLMLCTLPVFEWLAYQLPERQRWLMMLHKPSPHTIFKGSAVLYIAARLTLLSLPFISLRALPPRAFVDINWSVYIPHL
ncbi:hypothetical protein C8J57DRAFT_1185305 [Mycena rebaudengoi]|nr:hypothetical protein C8J57DRAFT_1185305 [Mycena rebaudengoi]